MRPLGNLFILALCFAVTARGETLFERYRQQIEKAEPPSGTQSRPTRARSLHCDVSKDVTYSGDARSFFHPTYACITERETLSATGSEVTSPGTAALVWTEKASRFRNTWMRSKSSRKDGTRAPSSIDAERYGRRATRRRSKVSDAPGQIGS